MRHDSKAFTLIEILLVVAIIALLAAIATPSFVEVQTRAKVARVLTDFRTMGVGIEAYAVDHNVYPSCLADNYMLGKEYVQPFTRRVISLTTPVAYLTQVPQNSPFAVPNQAHTMGHMQYEYFDRTGVQVARGGDIPLLVGDFFLCAGLQVVDPSTYTPGDAPWGSVPPWVLSDFGPDGYESWEVAPTMGWPGAYVFYDPTNGTISLGEIMKSPWKGSAQ